MRATELKVVVRERGERESRSPEEGEVAFYASKTGINHVSIYTCIQIFKLENMVSAIHT